MSISPDGRSEITLKLCLLRQVEKKWVEEEQSVMREEVEDKEEGDDKVGASVKEEDKVVDQGDLFGVLQISFTCFCWILSNSYIRVIHNEIMIS